MLTKNPMIAYDRGYRVIDGKIVNTKTGTVRKWFCTPNGTDYPRFAMRRDGRCVSVKCHQLAAWQEFGPFCVGQDIEIRHLDDDKFNFRVENISLGNKEENWKDRIYNRKRKNKDAI